MRPGLTNQSSVTFRSTKPTVATGKAGSARRIRCKRGTHRLNVDGRIVQLTTPAEMDMEVLETTANLTEDRTVNMGTVPNSDKKKRIIGTRMGHPEVVEVEMELNVEVEKSTYRAVSLQEELIREAQVLQMVGEDKSPMHLVSARTKEVQANPSTDSRPFRTTPAATGKFRASLRRPPPRRGRRDLRDDRQESDSDRDSDSGNDNDEGAQKKRKRSSGKVCTNPRQEGFYPASWKKVFARAKDLVYIYLLLQNLFPERDEFKSVQISGFLHDAMLYVVDKLGIPLEKKYKKHLTNSDDMVELIWNFVATFRNRCKELAREILKTEYRAAIFPDQAQYRGRDEWTEKVKSNVEKLLDGSTYHEHGVDAQGRPNNLMHPAFERLAQSILSMGRRPLGQEFPEEFQKYRPKFIIAIMIFFRQTLEEWRTGVFVTGQLREAYYQGYYLRGLELLDELETYPDLWDKTNDEWDCWARKAGFQGKKKTGRRAVGAKEMRLRLN
ncbi:hypothetical protein K438DRAFT_1939424 [Mycena galopus ATCC 62051]|nr:hypothetical protein K438DRAFT_1939424 [Mycena galopus ATCC 62051]